MTLANFSSILSTSAVPSRSVDVAAVVKYSHVSKERILSIISVTELASLIAEFICTTFLKLYNKIFCTLNKNRCGGWEEEMDSVGLQDLSNGIRSP